MNREIVVPILAKEKLIAQLDIESYFSDTFTTEQDFVEECSAIVGKYFWKSSQTV